MQSMSYLTDSLTRRRFAYSLLATVLVTGCTPEINHRGYYAKSGALSQVNEGMAKSEVEAIMGSPSTTASVNF
jgi:outer membrane protein assembly factor BamE (lipoprotein component of BamABCDE complex)